MDWKKKKKKNKIKIRKSVKFFTLPLNTINEEKNYNKLVLTLNSLSERSNTIKNLCQRLEKNPLNFKTKSNSVLVNLQKGMLLAFFLDKELQHELIIEKPIAVILDNYSVHHAIFFTEVCNVLNMDLIHLPPYSPKYNPIEQVWRTIKATISRKYISSMPQLKYLFLTEFKKVVDNSSYWKNWEEKFL